MDAIKASLKEDETIKAAAFLEPKPLDVSKLVDKACASPDVKDELTARAKILELVQDTADADIVKS